MLTLTDQLIPAPALAPPPRDQPTTFADADAFARWLNTHPAAPSAGEWTADAGEGWYGLALWCDTAQDPGQVRDLIGYWAVAEARVGGEWAPDPWPAGYPHLFCFAIDLTKTRRDDVGPALDALATYVRDGSPVRKTNKSGPVGTRAVAGLPGRVLVAWR